jgi:enterochelin esterase-like enzyme
LHKKKLMNKRTDLIKFKQKIAPVLIIWMILSLLISSCRPIAEAEASDQLDADLIQPTTIIQPVPTEIVKEVETPTTEISLTPAVEPASVLSEAASQPDEFGCQETTGRISKHEITTYVMPSVLKFRVYLPPCYDPDREEGYPVLYLLHGQQMTPDVWDELSTFEIADRLISSGKIVPFIIVTPEEEYFLKPPTESFFGEGLVHGLIPWTDQIFNTCQDRDCRAIGGISRGAGWALNLGYANWEMFGHIGCHSLPPFMGEDANVSSWATHIPEEELPRLHIDIGAWDDYYKPASFFEAALDKYRLPHEWIVYPGGHTMNYWSEYMESYIWWYALAWAD